MAYEKGIILQITLLPRELRAKGVKFESKGRRSDATVGSRDCVSGLRRISVWSPFGAQGIPKGSWV